MFSNTYIFLIICTISGFIAYRGTNSTPVLVARIVFSVTLIALLAHTPHPDAL